jgi:hypothetical protein
MKRASLLSDLTSRISNFNWRLLLVILLFSASAFAQTNPAAEAKESEVIAPGVEHFTIRRGDFTLSAGQDRWMIHALVVDPQRARLALARALDELVGAETTSSLAARHSALAAVNGGYFRTAGIYRGESVGTLVSGGKILSEPVRRRAALAVAHTGNRIRAAIASVELKAELRVAGKFSHPISGFNRPREADELIIFTPEFHRTTLTTPDGIEVIIERDRVVTLRDGQGSQPIPPEGYVISASGKARAWLLANLKRNAPVAISTEIIADPPLPFAAEFILGGGPRLLAAGNSVAKAEAERYSESLFRERHPRTALGWRIDGTLVIVTVDGRQQQSAGMTIDQLTRLMLDLGCVEAINLDGGGSTTMVIRNKVVNRPSDPTGERAVSDALLIFPR